MNRALTPMISTVSCSGPDDGNDPSEIALLPMLRAGMEIGVQASLRREGRREYPSRAWIMAFAAAAASAWPAGAARPRAALHLNGAWCRDACAGRMPPEVEALLALEAGGGPLFGRVQLNFDAADDGIREGPLLEALAGLSRGGIRPILQSRPGNEGLLAGIAAAGVAFDVLHDASCGFGARPARWPAGIPGRFNAWAGGISPETAAGDSAAIGAAASGAGLAEFGIDAQSGLRSPGGRFEPGRACALAEAAAAWGAGRPGASS